MSDHSAADTNAEVTDARWTIRGVPTEVRDRAVKGADLATPKLTVGKWVADAILAKWESDRAKPRSLATIPTPVAERLIPKAVPEPMLALDVTHHLAVLASVSQFANPGMSDPVRQAADRVIIDRLRLLRIVKPRQTKSQKSLPNGAV